MILLLISSISLYKTVQGHIFDGILFPSRLCSFSFNFALLNACSFLSAQPYHPLLFLFALTEE